MKRGSCNVTNPSKQNNVPHSANPFKSIAPKSTWPTILWFEPRWHLLLYNTLALSFTLLHPLFCWQILCYSFNFPIFPSLCSWILAIIISNRTLLLPYNNQPPRTMHIYKCACLASFVQCILLFVVYYSGCLFLNTRN